MKFFFCILFISMFSKAGWAQGLPGGTYKGTRICSDGSTPTDTLGKNPVFMSFRADGFYTSSADLFENGGICSELTAGTYRFTNNTIYSTSEIRERCGDCGNTNPNRNRSSESKVDLELIPNGFVMRFQFTQYQQGGSCKPGQHMIVKFERVNDRYEDLARSCKPVETM